MKTGKTLLQLAQEIERQKEAKLDLVARTEAVEMQLQPLDVEEVQGGNGTPGWKEQPPTVQLVVGSNGDRRTFGVNDHAHDQLAAGLEIPRAYYHRMRERQPELLTRNVNTWLRAEPATRMIRTLDGNVRAWLSDRYRPLDNEQLIEFLGPIFETHGAGLEVMSSEITEKRLYLKLTYPAVQGEVKVGDVVQAGFVISNSEVGAGALSAYPFILTLRCTNGMKIETAGQRRNHVGRQQLIEAGGEVIEYRQDTQRASDRAIMLKVRDTVEACLSTATFERILDELRRSTQSPEMKKPEKAVEVLAKSVGLTDDERSSVLRHLILGGDLTAYGAANAITRAAEDASDYDRASELERTGYQVIEMATKGNGSAWESVAVAA